MELWEGAALVVGGLWLIGRMSRKTAPTGNLASVAAASNQVGAATVQAYAPLGPAGESSNGQTTPLMAGEGFAPAPAPMIQVGGAPVAVQRPAVNPTKSSAPSVAPPTAPVTPSFSPNLSSVSTYNGVYGGSFDNSRGALGGFIAPRS